MQRRNRATGGRFVLDCALQAVMTTVGFTIIDVTLLDDGLDWVQVLASLAMMFGGLLALPRIQRFFYGPNGE